MQHRYVCLVSNFRGNCPALSIMILHFNHRIRPSFSVSAGTSSARRRAHGTGPTPPGRAAIRPHAPVHGAAVDDSVSVRPRDCAAASSQGCASRGHCKAPQKAAKYLHRPFLERRGLCPRLHARLHRVRTQRPGLPWRRRWGEPAPPRAAGARPRTSSRTYRGRAARSGAR